MTRTQCGNRRPAQSINNLQTHHKQLTPPIRYNSLFSLFEIHSPLKEEPMKFIATLTTFALFAFIAVSLNAQAPATVQTNASADGKTINVQVQCECSKPAPPKDPWVIERENQLKNDWPWLGKFAEANSILPAPAASESRVVFMGDSITEGWKLAESFPGKPYINRGISGQTAPQMVLRFRQDVIDLKPKAVVILAGTNDIAGNTGAETPEQIEGFLADMSNLAHANGIRVILTSILPVYDYPWTPGIAPAKKIIAINAWIKKYAAEHNDIYVDYHSVMKDERDGLPKTLAGDGVHPNPAGYAIMAKLVETAIEQAVK
jgi:lysophospholipase L1-like esterase